MNTNNNEPMPTKPIVSQSRRRRDTAASGLRFSPTAWAKLIYLRDCGQTEVGGFAISAADDLMLVEDVQMVRQAARRSPSSSTTSR